MAIDEKDAKPVKAKVAKKKAVKPVVKTEMKTKNKVTEAANATSAISTLKVLKLKGNLTRLTQEVADLKATLKAVKKREKATSQLSVQRDIAVNRFLKSWDKKANAALEKALATKKKK